MAEYPNWYANGHPAYHDAAAMVECYVDWEGYIAVSLPSDVSLTPDQAEKFGNALIECARWRRRNPPVESHD